MGTFLAVLALAFGSWAGADHPPGPVSYTDGPPKPAMLVDLFNRPERVHGFWVNFTDVFFYAGETTRLNDFLQAYSRIEGLDHELVLRVGPTRAQSPWDEKPRDLDADWKITTMPGGVLEGTDPDLIHARIEVWLGRAVDLDDLVVPENVEVTSGGEIDEFIERR